MNNNWDFSSSEIVYKGDTVYGPRVQTNLQLVYVFEGQAEIIIEDDTSYTVGRNQATMLLPGLKETFHFAKGTRHGWCYARVDDYPGNLLSGLRSAPKVIPFNKDMSAVEAVMRNHPACGSSATRECRTKLIAALFAMYFAELGIALGEPAPVMHPALAKAESFMQLNLGNPLTLDQIAGQVGMTPAHLIRLYKVHFEETPVRRLWHHRLALAANLLKETGLTAAEISERCGFSNPQHFSRQFRQHFGQTPRQMRLRSWGSEAK